MKANRAPRSKGFADEDSGVSAVIGAVLVFGLFSSAFIIWSFTTLPVWIADNEAQRNDDVQQSFSTLNDGLNLLAASGGSGPISASFPLAADEVPLLQPAPSIGRLYHDDGFAWDATYSGTPGCGGGQCDQSVNGGRIVFEPLNYHFLDQDVVWDGGAVIRSQADGDVVVSSPGFDLSLSGSVGTLQWTVVALDGTGDIGGDGSADVVLTMDQVDEQSNTANAGTVEFTLDTPYCDAWHSLLSSRILLAGLSSNDAVLTACTGDQLTLTLDQVDDVTTWVVETRVFEVTATVGA